METWFEKQDEAFCSIYNHYSVQQTPKQAAYAKEGARTWTNLLNELNTIVPAATWKAEHRIVKGAFNALIHTQKAVEALLPKEKNRRAKELRDRFHSPRRFLVDALEGDIHRIYSGVPNMSWVLDHTSRIVFKGSWTKINDVRSGLERAIQMREIKRGNTVIIQYYRENIEYTVTKRPIASSDEANALAPNVS